MTDDFAVSRGFERPRVVVSQCLGFAACRYNAQMVNDDFVARLAPHVEFIEVCPEVGIGLGTPREPIRLVRGRAGEDDVALIQPATGRELTDAMRSFSQRFLDGVSDVDGFVLKNRSPSCGTAGVKVYPEAGGAPVGKAPGMFAAAVLERFGDCAIEDEGRLRARAIREHFLLRLYAFARLRAVAATGRNGALVEFHSRYKYVLMSYSQQRARGLGRIVAGVKQTGFEAAVRAYRAEFAAAVARPVKAGAQVNTLMHILGYFSDHLTTREKALLLDLLQDYRDGRAALGSVLSVLRAWVVRFELPYLAEQALFEPYPRELLSLADSQAKG